MHFIPQLPTIIPSIVPASFTIRQAGKWRQRISIHYVNVYTYWFQFFRISFKFSKLSSVIKGTTLGRSLDYLTERGQKVGAEGEVKEYLHERIPTRLAWIAGVSSIHPRRVLKKKIHLFRRSSATGGSRLWYERGQPSWMNSKYMRKE